jgi:hypothetical protein
MSISSYKINYICSHFPQQSISSLSINTHLDKTTIRKILTNKGFDIPERTKIVTKHKIKPKKRKSDVIWIMEFCQSFDFLSLDEKKMLFNNLYKIWQWGKGI